MSFSQVNGYLPVSFESLMDQVREGINTQFGTTYTSDSFIGTGWYKYFYALVQKLQENEVKTSEVFLKLQEYISSTNEAIQRPSVSHPGLVDSFTSQGYTASIKQTTNTDAGKIFICVDVDSGAAGYAAKKLAICTLIKDFVAAGLITQGTESSNITLSNGQSFAFKYNLPVKTPILLKATLTISSNTLLPLPTDIQVRQIIFDNINSRYRLGYNFEPQRYFTFEDAPWASSILLQYSINAGTTWLSAVNVAAYTDLYTFALSDIAVVGLP